MGTARLAVGISALRWEPEPGRVLTSPPVHVPLVVCGVVGHSWPVQGQHEEWLSHEPRLKKDGRGASPGRAARQLGLFYSDLQVSWATSGAGWLLFLFVITGLNCSPLPSRVCIINLCLHLIKHKRIENRRECATFPSSLGLQRSLTVH